MYKVYIDIYRDVYVVHTCIYIFTPVLHTCLPIVIFVLCTSPPISIYVVHTCLVIVILYYICIDIQGCLHPRSTYMFIYIKKERFLCVGPHDTRSTDCMKNTCMQGPGHSLYHRQYGRRMEPHSTIGNPPEKRRPELEQPTSLVAAK